MDIILKNALGNSVDYGEYLRMFDEYVRQNRTSGSNQSPELAAYTKLNYSRVKRLNKMTVAHADNINLVSALPFDMKWVVITEAWCGDAAQNIPYIHKLAEACTNVTMRLVFRDENLAFMDRHLTNGSRSIPKLVVYRAEDMQLIGTWGPRPESIQQVILENKNSENGLNPMQLAEQLHGWYAKDKNRSLEKELSQLFAAVSKRQAV